MAGFYVHCIGFLIGISVGIITHLIYQNNRQREAEHRTGNRSSVPIKPGERCMVCQEELCTPLEQLPCSHLFHQQCLLKWLEVSTKCPICRFQLKREDVEVYLNRMD